MNSFDLFGNPDSSRSLEEKSTYSKPSFHLPPEYLDESVEEDQRPVPRLGGLFAGILLSALVLGLQCFKLQVTEGAVNRTKAEGNSIRLITVPSDRGLITDANGTILAQNSRQLALAIDRQSLPAKKADRQTVYDQLKKDAGISQDVLDYIEKNLQNIADTFPVKTNLSKDESLLYKEKFAATKGVVLQEIPTRRYAQFPSMGQILGYVGTASESDTKAGYTAGQRIGKTGLEQEYNSALSGVSGRQKAEVNAFGEVVNLIAGGEESQPKAGKTLKLSIDLKLQNIVSDALKHELERRKKQYGDLKDHGASAVVLDPNTGAVLSMVSLPDYDGQKFADGISTADYAKLINDPANPLLNRTIQGQYPSGSVIKPLIAGAALQAGIVTPGFQVYTPDAINIGSFRFPDWKLHGQTNIRKAIAESNDIFFYALGGGWPEKNMKGLGIDALNSWLAKYGLGSPTGIDLPSEEGGLLAGPAWKEKNVGEQWYIGDTYHASIGQGYTLTTPLQMAVATAAVANGSTVWKPTLASGYVDSTTGQETKIAPVPLFKDFVSAGNMQVVRDGMRQTVETGSAHPLNTLKVTSAGKTGTAEFGDKGLTHAWYTGFAPYDKPQIVFSIIVEGGGESFYSSVPVAEEILRNYFNDPLLPGQKLNSEPNLTAVTDFQGEH